MILTTEILLSMTPEQQMKSIVKEKYKCYTDFKYLIETYFTVDAGGTRIPFILFPHQEDALNAYINFPNNITMKTRQMGFTTFTAAYVAACMINKNGFKCLIISKEQKSSMDFLKAIKDILSECRKMTQLSGAEDSQSWLVPDFAKGYNNKKDFILENGSLVTAQGNTDNAGRGIPGLHLAIVDEVAFIDNNTPDRMSNIWAALGPALSTVKGKTIMISCVTKDTFVFTNNGIQEIGDFIKDDDGIIKGYKISEYNILGHNGMRKSNLFKNNGYDKTYKIKTKYSELEGHKDHKIYTYSNGQYGPTKMSDLKIGDYVNIKNNMEIWGNNNDTSDFIASKIIRGFANKFNPKIICKDLGYFLGLYIAEGCMTINKNNGGWIDITCGDSEITKNFDKLNLRWTTIDNLHYRICSKNLIEFMQYLGFKQEKAPLKEIPKRLMKCSREVLIALLQGLFDGDGCIYLKNNNAVITLTSTSEKLCNQVRMLLANVGILSSKYMWAKENDKGHLDKNGVLIKMNYDRHTLELSSKFSDMFIEKIGFQLERKKNKIVKLTNQSFCFDIPNGDEIIEQLYKEGHTGQSLRRLHNIRIDNKKITSNKIYEIFDILKDKDFKNKAKEEFLFDDDSIWVPIKFIEEKENYTYDVSLSENKQDKKWCHSVIHSLVSSYNTPKGSGGWYYDTYTNADAMGFNVIEAHWTKHPLFSQGQYSWIHDATHPDGGYIKFYNKTWPDTLFDKASKSYLKIEKDSYNFIRDGKIRSPWYDFESKKLGPRLTLCELDCSFVGTGGEVFEGDILREFKLHAQASEFVNIAEFFNGFLRDYKEFKAPEEGHKYVISSDVATGDGSDYSTFVILDLNTLEICGTFKGQMLPSVLARMLYTIGKRFGTPPIVVENAGGGGSTLQDLKEMGYPNIFYSTLNKKDESLGVKKRKIGLWVSEEVRKKGGDKLEQYIRDGLLKIPCMWIAEEFFHWIWDKDGKRRHAPGKHDDMIMALQHAIYYHAFVYKRNTRNRENFRTMFDIQRNGYEYDNDMGRGMIASHNTEFNPHVEKRNNGLDIIDQKKNFGDTSQEQKIQPRIRFL